MTTRISYIRFFTAVHIHYFHVAVNNNYAILEIIYSVYQQDT